MAMINAFQDLLNAMRRVGFRVVLAGNDILEQFATSDQIEDQIVVALLLNRIVQSNDVRMVQFATDSRLPIQLLKVTLRELLCVNYLGRKFKASGSLQALSNDRKCASLMVRVVFGGLRKLS